MQVASAKSRSRRGATRQPAFLGSRLTISHTCLACLPSIRTSPCILCPLMIAPMVAPLTFFSQMVSMILVLWGIGAILENGYGSQGQNYVALLQGSKMSAGFYCKNLILGICFRLIKLNM